MIGIYKITNLVNGKVYVGQSIDIEGRLKKHFRGGHNEHLRNALAKYGRENFSIEVLEECLREDLNAREAYYVGLLDATNPRKGYNKKTGGVQGRPTAETRRKLSLAHLGVPHPHTAVQDQRLSEALMGHPVSAETREKMSEAKKGKPSWNKGKAHSEEHRKALKDAWKRRRQSI